MKHVGWSGFTLMCGGVVLFLVNAVFSPQLKVDAPFAELAASSVFLWRVGLAAFGVFLLLASLPELCRRHATGAGAITVSAFALAFTGSALLFAHEWSQVFFVRALALAAPDALGTMENVEGLDAFEIEGVIVVSVFSVGWIAAAIAMFAAGAVSRLGAALVIVGFFAIPGLAAAGLGLTGAILGNLVLASGWILLGWKLRALEGASQAESA